MKRVNEYVHVIFACGHTGSVSVISTVPREVRKEIASDYKESLCPKCSAIKLRLATRYGHKAGD